MMRIQAGVFALFMGLALGSPAYGTQPVAVSPVKEKAAKESKPLLKEGLEKPYPAPELEGIAQWLQSSPLTLESLKGKVVLLDFWAYSCVNCIRTLPYLTGWDKEYRDKGLVIIGLHAPEFDFEKNPANVEKAIRKWKVAYPIALDSNMKTWNRYENRYWPAKYLIDQKGNVVYTHFGEGNYDVTEHNIRMLLGLEKEKQAKSTSIKFDEEQTPETYLGYRRIMQFYNDVPLLWDIDTVYNFTSSLPLHGWTLNGKWKVGPESVTSIQPGASLKLHFYAKKVFLVLGSQSGAPVNALVTLGGKPLGESAGKDAPQSNLTVDSHMLYELIDQPQAKEGVIEIMFKDTGAQAYAFTFGG